MLFPKMKNSLRRHHPAKLSLCVLFFGLCLTSLLGCQSSLYYGQAARGQLSLIAKRQSIETLVKTDETPDALREQLEHILEFREFATTQLALPIGKSYSTYVDLEREHVVRNVFAAPEFSVTPKTWCYPIAGCASYRGYFSESAAEAYAHALEEQGFDVYVSGIDAYSTLGWFDDSVLSSFVHRPAPELASLIFHESAHQVLYVKGDTTFNESFATAVGREGLRRWLTSTNTAYDFQQTEARENRRRDFVQLVTLHRTRLEALYGQEISELEMREGKTRILEELRTSYEHLKKEWGGYEGYDAWFSDSLNNAKLSTVSTYNDLVPEFLDLLQEKDGDLEAFYKACQELAQEPEDLRLQKLRSQGARGAPPVKDLR